MLSVTMLTVAMLSVAMLSVAMLSVTMLSVEAQWTSLLSYPQLNSSVLNLAENGLAYYTYTSNGTIKKFYNIIPGAVIDEFF
jgi:hypothetical protein